MTSEDLKQIAELLNQQEERMTLRIDEKLSAQEKRITLLIDTKLQPISERLDGMETKIGGIEAKIEKLQEDAQITREGVESLLDWADECGRAVRFPLPEVK